MKIRPWQQGQSIGMKDESPFKDEEERDLYESEAADLQRRFERDNNHPCVEIQQNGTGRRAPGNGEAKIRSRADKVRHCQGGGEAA